MSRFKTVLLSVLLLPVLANANDWTTQDTYREAIVYIALALDATQTLDIKRHQGMYETNPLLGKHPTDRKIIGYFLGVAAAHTGIAAILPTPYREYFQNGTIALELMVIGNNKRIGLSARF